MVEDDRFLIFNWLTMTPIISFEMKPPPAKCAVRSFTSSVSTFLVLANLSLTRPSIADKASGSNLAKKVGGLCQGVGNKITTHPSGSVEIGIDTTGEVASLRRIVPQIVERAR